MVQPNSERRIQSVANACELIEALRETDVSTVTELADQLDLSPGTIHTYLATLREHSFVVQTESEYRLGPQLLTLGEYVKNHSEFYQASKEQIEKLADETGECAHLITEHDGQLYALDEQFGENAVGVEYHNRKRERPLTHLHCTAAGKAILAHLPDERVEGIISWFGLPQNTQNTITDPDNLFEELETIADRGYSFANEEQMENIRAVGAPVTLPSQGVVGAIAISGPTARLRGERFHEEFPRKITNAANVCEVNLQTKNLREDVV